MSCFRAKDLFIVFFFFQAEDGIRDYKVTGVQTCALPICSGAAASEPIQPPDGQRQTRRVLRCRRTDRSEERRVGKECRSRWSPYHYTKNASLRRRAPTTTAPTSSWHWLPRIRVATTLAFCSASKVPKRAAAVAPHQLFCFSSRRRHTSLQGDWSSDVCSSDLRRRANERVGSSSELFHSRLVAQY